MVVIYRIYRITASARYLAHYLAHCLVVASFLLITLPAAAAAPTTAIAPTAVIALI